MVMAFTRSPPIPVSSKHSRSTRPSSPTARAWMSPIYQMMSATPFREGGAPGTPILPLADVERQHILAVLDAAAGNRTRAAALLGIGPATLFRKLRLYGQRG
jgi:transcriptional regulator of acetoin/glycerol metabolism